MTDPTCQCRLPRVNIEGVCVRCGLVRLRIVAKSATEPRDAA